MEKMEKLMEKNNEKNAYLFLIRQQVTFKSHRFMADTDEVGGPRTSALWGAESADAIPLSCRSKADGSSDMEEPVGRDSGRPPTGP